MTFKWREKLVDEDDCGGFDIVGILFILVAVAAILGFMKLEGYL